MIKAELHITADGAISLVHDTGENMELTVRYGDGGHVMTVASGVSTYIGRAIAVIKGGGRPHGASAFKR